MDPSSFNNPELQQLLQQEKQKAVVNEMIGKLTSRCWDKCITGTPGNSFSSSESTCLTNCAQRYMDTAMFVMRRLQQ
ncbi:mitochondrial import inner membrane translocase subunit TIM8-like [Salvia miltiorrhiza]|uniref:mitochondrial import inner membrane translocase subunit TIM8-like n=1 Tax=Salvia miltiorrhiza TaxID=226208 RepID=UPI0025ABE791|nr:mitochondrial import inner membrane translocase subunit TIM8-like [Salvia miltiorrhiza]